MKKLDFRRFADYGILALALAVIVQIGLLVPKVATTMAGGSDWGLSFPEEGAQPRGNAAPADLAQYDAFFMGSAEQKVLYLTFDCGYENGNTAAILDTLKAQQVPAAFFVTGHYLEQSPDLIARMAQEGHIVGNHTYSHPDMSKISTQEALQKELNKNEALYQDITGQPMPKYYRPPAGKYSIENLQNAKALGYKTMFWSLAYVDWLQDDQPTREQALDKLLPRTHCGAVILLHNTSSTNAAILNDLIQTWKSHGYTFATLDQLTSP